MVGEIPSGRWLSLDVAKGASGVAVWHGRTFERAFTVKTPKGDWFQRWAPIMAPVEPELLVIEDGYVGLNKSTSLVLAGARKAVEVVGQAIGCDRCVLVKPSAWRKLVGITPGSRENVKHQAEAKCRWLGADPATRPPPRSASASSAFFAGIHIPGAGEFGTDAQEAVLIGLAYQRSCARSV